MTDAQLTDDEIVTAAREAPIAKRSSADVERAAERFVTATQERTPKKTRAGRRGVRAPLWVVALAVVVVGVGAFVAGRVSMSSSADDHGARGVEVHAAPGATLDRVEGGSVRAARLYEGSATFAVPKSATAERFLVVTGDAEVSGDGLFEVTAAGDRIARVRVLDGAVVVRAIDGTVTNVVAGSSWSAGKPAASSSDDGARDRLNAALALLSSGELDKAAAAFKAEEVAGSPVLEDATFWEAIALARANHGGVNGAEAQHSDGRVALESFLARFPKSQHRAEALGVLGWKLLDAGDRRGAESAFREAVKSDDARVHDSADAGLRKLGLK